MRRLIPFEGVEGPPGSGGSSGLNDAAARRRPGRCVLRR